MSPPTANSRLTSLLLLTGALTITAADARLAHRWSFDGDLSDSIGGRTAAILEDDNNSQIGGRAIVSNKALNLSGGAYDKAQYVDLGSNLFGDAKQITIELWATQREVTQWSRIFNICAAKGNVKNNTSLLFMSWNRSGEIDHDMVQFSLAKEIKNSKAPDTCAPYEIDREYHIVMKIDNSTAGTTKLTWYVTPSDAKDLGAPKGTLTSDIDLDEFEDNFAYLGRSTWSDPIAKAQYNEVRIYHSALTQQQLEQSHDNGPAGYKTEIPEPTSLPLYGSLIALLYTVTCRRRSKLRK